jgi:beta-glucosidase-like glycosyl hydrolase
MVEVHAEAEACIRAPGDRTEMLAAAAIPENRLSEPLLFVSEENLGQLQGIEATVTPGDNGRKCVRE